MIEKVVKEAKRIVADMEATKDYTVTSWISLYEDDRETQAIVFGWVDYDGDNNYKLYGKIATNPKYSLMQEYDMDWDMPGDTKTGEIWDTETDITSNNIEETTRWWLDEYDRMIIDEIL